MAYTTIKKPLDYFNTKLYTGDNTSNRSITGVGFQPDLVWNKTRNQTFNHYIFDSVRGAGEMISSNLANAEGSYTSEFLSFDSDGFSVTQNGGSLGINWSSGNYANWCWLGANGTASNTDGSITTTVSANTTSGVSIISYTGNSTSGATIGHGLGDVPKFFMIKSRDRGDDWNCYHQSIGNTAFIALNSTSSYVTASNRWNNTTPSSSVITLGDGTAVNYTDNFICYAFAEKKGFSKFGSYTGNGSTDGTFVYTGFKPAFVMSKRTDSAGNSWRIFDNKRQGYNGAMGIIHANLTDTESVASTIDFLSNGFKIRTTSTDQNTSGASYIYMAIAEEPLVGDNPATAR